MSYWTSFIGCIVASKVLVDETKIPYQFYEALKPTVSEIESWSQTFGSLEIDKPHTWVKTGMKVLERVSHVRDPYSKISTDLISESMRRLEHGYINFEAVSDIIREAVLEADIKLIFEDKPYRLYHVALPNKTSMFMRTSWSYKEYMTNKKDTTGLECKFFLPSNIKKLKPVLEGIGDLFWETRKHLVLDKVSSYKEISYKPLEVENRGYDGDAFDYIEEWKTFREAGVRRCVLLQGDPGTGKSTLARDAAAQLSKRTLHLTSDFLLNIARDEWSILNRTLRPDVIVADDIDRISHDHLANRLHLFEDAYHQVPLTIFTANHYTNLPDAFLRPGRIDQILELDGPDDSRKAEILKSLAAKEGVLDIPKEKMKILLRVYQNYSGAYVVEYLRRVKVLGWDYQIPKKDLTFQKIYGFENDLENETSQENLVSFRVHSEEDRDSGRKTLNINPVTLN